MAIKYTIVKTDGEGRTLRHTSTTPSRTHFQADDWHTWWDNNLGTGGAHDWETCAPCALRAMGAMARTASANDDDFVHPDKAYEEYARNSFNAKWDEQRKAAVITNDEYDYLIDKQFARMMRVASNCPVRRLPSVIREIETMIRVAKGQWLVLMDNKEQSKRLYVRVSQLTLALATAQQRQNKAKALLSFITMLRTAPKEP